MAAPMQRLAGALKEKRGTGTKVDMVLVHGSFVTEYPAGRTRQARSVSFFNGTDRSKDIGAVCGKVHLVENTGVALQHPDRVIAQVLDIGDYDDVQKLVAQVGDEYLREMLARAEIGQFSARSWA